MERINFPPYSKDQLVEIAQSRLIAHPNPPPQAIIEDHQVIETDALNLAAAKTTGVTGDARRMLDVCRRAVEVAISSAVSSGNSKDGTKPQPVKMRQISAVLAEMSRNPTAQFVRSCSLYEKVMLAAVVRGIRKTGVGELEWGRVRSPISRADPPRAPVADDRCLVYCRSSSTTRSSCRPSPTCRRSARVCSLPNTRSCSPRFCRPTRFRSPRSPVTEERPTSSRTGARLDLVAGWTRARSGGC